MTDLSKQAQFELDARALALGALPEAPLAMPVQQLEPAGGSFLAALAAILRPQGATKAGH